MKRTERRTAAQSRDSGHGGTITPTARQNASQRPTAAHRAVSAFPNEYYAFDAIRAAAAEFYTIETRAKKNAAPRCRACGEIMTPDEIILDERGPICETCFNSLCIPNAHRIQKPAVEMEKEKKKRS